MGMEPSEALDFFESKVRTAFPDAKPDRDRMSLRIPHEGVVLEVLPAVRREGQLCIPSESGKTWSKINPQGFFRKLTEINDRYGGEGGPTIKKNKEINEKFPTKQSHSGEHIQYLA